MKTTVLLFAAFRERLKTDHLILELPEGSVAGHILDRLCATTDEAAAWRRTMKVAVNRRYVAHDTLLHEGDEVALIPPVSGG